MADGWVSSMRPSGWFARIPAVAGTLFSALVYISPQKVTDNATQVGERLRGFTALDENGDDQLGTPGIPGQPVPTTILVEANGVVRWIDQSENYQRL